MRLPSFTNPGVPVLALVALFASSPTTLAATDALGIAGSWSVVSTFTDSTCGKPNDTGGVDAYMWLVGVDAAGNYHVSVQGATAYSRLSGKPAGTTLHLVGLESDGNPGPLNAILASDGGPFSDGRTAYLLGRSELTLALKDGALVGTRTVLLVEPQASGQRAYYAACRVDYTIVATRG